MGNSVQTSAGAVGNSPYSVTSWSFNSKSNDDLIEESIISLKDGDKLVNSHSEVGDSVVDRLLLRDLFSYE